MDNIFNEEVISESSDEFDNSESNDEFDNSEPISLTPEPVSPVQPNDDPIDFDWGAADNQVRMVIRQHFPIEEPEVAPPNSPDQMEDDDFWDVIIVEERIIAGPNRPVSPPPGYGRGRGVMAFLGREMPPLIQIEDVEDNYNLPVDRIGQLFELVRQPFDFSIPFELQRMYALRTRLDTIIQRELNRTLHQFDPLDGDSDNESGVSSSPSDEEDR